MSDKIRVLFLTNLPSPYRVEFFSKLGNFCDLTVVYERPSAADRNKAWKKYSSGSFREIYLKGLKIGRDTAFSPGIIKVLRRNYYDVIVAGMYSTPTEILAIAYLKATRSKFVISTDGGFISNDSKIKFALKKMLIGSSSWWLSPSIQSDRYLEFYGANKDNIHRYSFSSINKSDVKSTIASIAEKHKIRQEMGMQGRYIVTSVGRPIESKGFDTLIDAFERANIQGSSLYLVGGTREEFVAVAGRELPSNVYTIPFQQKETVMKLYRGADVFALATRSDVWGLVINEAMSMVT